MPKTAASSNHRSLARFLGASPYLKGFVPAVALAAAGVFFGFSQQSTGNQTGIQLLDQQTVAANPVAYYSVASSASLRTAFDDDQSLSETMAKLEAMDQDQLQELFNEYLKSWRSNFAKLAQGQSAFYNRPESESSKWATQFRIAKREGEKARKAAGLVAVELASRIEGELDPDLGAMVYYSMDEYLVFEKFELAYRAGKVLASKNSRDGRTLALAGYAAYSTNHFTEAREYFSEAIVAGYKLPLEYEKINEILDEAVEEMKKEEGYRQAEANNPIATIETTKGVLVVELLEDHAPNAVANFINLAEANFFDGQQFYDTSVSFLTTGSPTNAADGNAGYSIESEADRDNRRVHLRGSLTLMVIPDLGTGSSQFSILTQPMLELSSTKNTVFGRVIEGDLVLDDIARVGENWQEFAKKAKQPLSDPDRIKSVKISDKRDHDYKVKKFGQ